MTQGHDSAEAPDARIRNLAAAAAELLEQAAVAPAGRAALTLVPGAGAPLKQTLLAFRGGVQLAEHEPPGAATLHVLDGRVRLVAGREHWELGTGDHIRSRPSGIGWSAWRTLRFC